LEVSKLQDVLGALRVLSKGQGAHYDARQIK
jgi:hypothetical protein